MLPKRVRVRHRYYRIKMVDAKLVQQNGRPCRGFCSYEHREIWISLKQTRRGILSTFFHELAHAFSHEYRLKNVSHTAIYQIEGPLADIFLMNPSLRRLILKWRLPRGTRLPPAE